ncbi:MAG: hypothetical protein WD314_10425 [Trueperaceae bacterium]
MLKTALLLFAVTVTVLVILAVLPERERTLPDQRITLSNARVTLYPEADPQAIWRFQAPEASYDPERNESTLYQIADGRREVAGDVDFTVASEKLTINRRDDILGELVFAFLVETGECLTMQGNPEAPVVIDQEQGKFEVPVLEITGPSWGDDTRLEQMSVSFDLEDFDGGGTGTTTVTEFRVGQADEARRRTVCESS